MKVAKIISVMSDGFVPISLTFMPYGPDEKNGQKGRRFQLMKGRIEVLNCRFHYHIFIDHKLGCQQEKIKLECQKLEKEKQISLSLLHLVYSVSVARYKKIEQIITKI